MTGPVVRFTPDYVSFNSVKAFEGGVTLARMS